LRNWLAVLLALSCSLSSWSDPEIIEHQIADDGWVEVPLDFTFPFYGNSYVTSFMFSNGVVGFLDPLDVPGTGIVYDGLCCDGQDLSSFTGVRFNYTIMPWNTDLIDTGIGRFYTQGDETFQKYMWEDLSEYYLPNSRNTFDLTIYPMGNIDVNYEEVQITNHAVTVAVVGDLSQGEYEQWFYNHPTSGAVFWNSQQDDPVEIANGESVCSVIPDSHISCLYYPQEYADNVYNQQCALDPLYDYGCVGWDNAYLDQQCGISALYDESCDGWDDAYYEEYVEEDVPEVWEVDEEDIESVFVLEEPEIFEVIEIEALDDYTLIATTLEEAIPEMEDLFEEMAQEELIEEIEAELEEFLEPELEEEPLEEPIEEELDEPEPEEDTVQEEQTEEEPEQEAVVEVVEQPVLKKVAKKASKKDKMREIIGNKLKNLATEMGEAASLEEQQKLQSLILALLNFNAGFNSYNTQLLIDGVFYEDKGIYLDKDIPDNQRGLRNGLANEILHNKLMDLQWQR
jgi:hypothetical protein